MASCRRPGGSRRLLDSSSHPGTFWPGEVKGRLRRVTIGALRVNGVESLGTRAADRSLRFVIETPMARSTDTLTIGLPQVDGVRTAFATLRIGLATRAIDRSPSLSDAELRVPIVAASAPTVPSPLSRRAGPRARPRGRAGDACGRDGRAPAGARRAGRDVPAPRRRYRR